MDPEGTSAGFGASARGALEGVLERSRLLGHLGPQPLDELVDHALAFAPVVAAARGSHGAPETAVDLGTGGGAPGLVLATLGWPTTRWWFIEVRQARAQFLREAVGALDLEDRVMVLEERAEVAGRLPALRAQCELVTARSFGRPAVTAECAAPLLAVDGLLVVSEPPTPPLERWPVEGLAQLGLDPEGAVAGPPSFALFRQAEPCPDRFPRRAGRAEKRPLF